MHRVIPLLGQFTSVERNTSLGNTVHRMEEPPASLDAHHFGCSQNDREIPSFMNWPLPTPKQKPVAVSRNATLDPEKTGVFGRSGETIGAVRPDTDLASKQSVGIPKQQTPERPSAGHLLQGVQNNTVPPSRLEYRGHTEILVVGISWGLRAHCGASRRRRSAHITVCLELK
jgi:hypothetical protein